MSKNTEKKYVAVRLERRTKEYLDMAREVLRSQGKHKKAKSVSSTIKYLLKLEKKNNNLS